MQTNMISTYTFFKYRFLFSLAIMAFSGVNLYAQNEFEISREFTLFTSKNASAYLKPLFTTIGEGLNTSLYTVASYDKTWSIGINVSFMGMLIPQSQKEFGAELPDKYGDSTVVKTAELRGDKIILNKKGYTSEPTIYGGISNPVFTASQNKFPPDSFYKSIAFIEGNNISFMPAIPILQLVAGFPTMTQIRFCYFSITAQGAPLTYYTIVLNQNFDKIFGIFSDEKRNSLAINLAYHSIKRNPGLDIMSYAFGVHYSRNMDDGLSLYSGAQYEYFGGSVRAVRKDFKKDDIVNNPYEEIRLGLPLTITIESFNRFRLLGGLSYKYGIIELHGDIAYASQPVFNAGLSLMLSSTEAEPEVPMPDILPSTLIPFNPQMAQIPFKAPAIDPAMSLLKIEPDKRPPLLEADILAYGIEDGTEKELVTIKVEEFLSRQLRALLPFVFFDDNSDTLQSKYKLINPGETGQFSNKDLVGQSSLENYYNVLNIIGTRLRDISTAKITLTGCNTNIGLEKGNTALSGKRAQRVKDYLVNIWEIDPDRIEVISRNLPKQPSDNKTQDGMEENRRVEISSNNLSITAPNIVEDTIRKVYPPVIRFKPKVNSEDGLASWDISANYQENKFAEFKGRNTIENVYDWPVDHQESAKSKLSSAVEYTFNVADSKNQTYSTPVKSIPVEIKTIKNKEDNVNRDTLINVYDLILFDYNKATLGPGNKRITELIRSESTPESEITIVGFTDRIGLEKYNLKLSDKRAQTTAKAIGHKNTKAIGKGEGELIYDNNSPEGRFYCRTVVVSVKVPQNNLEDKK